MKCNLIGIALVACAIASVVSSCSRTDKAETLTLVTGVDPEHPYLKKQIQFLAATLEALNFELAVEQHQSAKCFELSNSGQVDGEIWRIYGIDAEFENLIRVPTAIWSHPELAFVKEDIELDSWESLAPYRVAFRVGTKVVENNIEGIVENQVPLDTIDEAFKKLVAGQVDVVISDNIVGSFLLEEDRYKDSGIRQVEQPLDSALLYTYLHKKHRALVQPLAEAISLAKRNGTYERIVGEKAIAD